MDTRDKRGHDGLEFAGRVAGVGNVLRHDYENIAAPILWKLAQADLRLLEKVCHEELEAEKRKARSE